MFFKNNLKNKNEPILEPIFRELRFGVALKELRKLSNHKLSIFDYGCGPEAKFYSYLKSKNIDFDLYCGYDPLLENDVIKDNLLITSNWDKVIKRKFDVATMFAVLEHVPYPDFDFGPIVDRLKTNGNLILTTPTKLAQPVLEFLSYKLGIVSRREIEEHQHYFDLKEIEKLFNGYGLEVKIKITFEFWMNNYVMLQKR